MKQYQTQTGSEQKSTLACEAPSDIFSQHKKAPVTDDLSYSVNLTVM